MQSIGFIGLGNVGGKLARTLIRNKFNIMVRDLDRTLAKSFIELGAAWADNPKIIAEHCDVVITCLPSPDTNILSDPDGPSVERTASATAFAAAILLL